MKAVCVHIRNCSTEPSPTPSCVLHRVYINFSQFTHEDKDKDKDVDEDRNIVTIGDVRLFIPFSKLSVHNTIITISMK